MDDSRIVELYWQRDAAAITASKEKYGAYCHTVARNILGSTEDAEECVNDTWLHAWNAIPPQRPGVLRLFLARITRGISFDRWKGRTAQKRGGGELPMVLDELADCLAAETDVEDDLIARELGESVRRFVAALPERESNLFVRRYFFTDSLEKIGASYGLTAGHVATILWRVRQKLKTQLIKEGYFV